LSLHRLFGEQFILITFALMLLMGAALFFGLFLIPQALNWLMWRRREHKRWIEWLRMVPYTTVVMLGVVVGKGQDARE
jgi:uncharacterized protein involved in cysteine biosynthesis